MGKKLDIIGKNFSRLTVCTELQPQNGRRKFWCFCQCGKWFATCIDHIIRGDTKSCGCLQKERVSQAKFIDLTGKKYNHITFCTRLPSYGKKKRSRWWIYCDCGQWKSIVADNVINGKTKSCGCFHSKLMKERIGIKHHLYNPNISIEDRKNDRSINRSPKYKEWVRNCFIKYNFTCQKCQIYNPLCGLNSHHIVPWGESRELRFDPDNAICFCSKCHSMYHSIYGKRNNCNSNTVEEFINKKILKEDLIKI